MNRQISAKSPRWRFIYLMPFFFFCLALMPLQANSHPLAFAPGSMGTAFIPHVEGSGTPYMLNPCAEAMWQTAKATMLAFSLPAPMLWSDVYFDEAMYVGYVAALGGALPMGVMAGAIGPAVGFTGALASFLTPVLPAACFPV